MIEHTMVRELTSVQEVIKLSCQSSIEAIFLLGRLMKIYK